MDRERFKSLRRKFTIVAGIIWLILTIIDVRASIKTGWFGIEYSSSLMPLGWWIPLVAGHYMAKSRARTEYAAEEVERIKAWKKRAQEEEGERKKRAQEDEVERIRAHRQRALAQYRLLILDNLDSANAFIDILSDPMYQDQKTMAKQKFTEALHQVIATIPLTDLTDVIRAHKEIEIQVHHLNARLKDHSIEDANMAVMLEAIKS